MKKENKGITLIALVITIIVVLILAGVTVATLTGDNGILIKAADAKDSNSIGNEKEKIGLAYNEYIIKKYTDANPELTIEGANVTGEGPWTILFTNIEAHKYTLSADGKTIDGPITVEPITFYLNEEECHSTAGVSWEEFITSWNLPDGWYYENGILYTGGIIKGFPEYFNLYGEGPVDGQEYFTIY